MSDPHNVFVREWHNNTTLHPLALAAIAACGLLLLILPRSRASWPFLLVACFLSSAQRLIIFGADFDLIRILLLFGIALVVFRGEYRGLRWHRLDTAIVIWGLLSACIPLLREGPQIAANRAGHLYNVFGLYFLARCYFQDWKDFEGLQRGLAYIAIPVALSFTFEWYTGHNPFSVFGGVRDAPRIRDNTLRCQGAFSHPILAGCFWASALPLIASQWWCSRRVLTIVSCTAALLVIFACGSATPLFAILSCIIAALAYPVRRHLRLIRWTLLATLLAAHLSMNAPVWHLIARTSSLGGSSWHRYALVNGAITHIHEWWLIGSRVGTAHWGHFTFDITNLYIAQAVEGGILLLATFLWTISTAFSNVGRTLNIGHLTLKQRMFTWTLGVSIFAHTVNHFGVSYFGQIWVLWYFILGCAGSLPTITTSAARAARTV